MFHVKRSLRPHRQANPSNNRQLMAD